MSWACYALSSSMYVPRQIAAHKSGTVKQRQAAVVLPVRAKDQLELHH